MHDLVRQSASGCGTVIALTHGSSALTYEQLWRQVITAGAGLQRIGLARNDRVAVFLEKESKRLSQSLVLRPLEAPLFQSTRY